MNPGGSHTHPAPPAGSRSSAPTAVQAEPPLPYGARNGGSGHGREHGAAAAPDVVPPGAAPHNAAPPGATAGNAREASDSHPRGAAARGSSPGERIVVGDCIAERYEVRSVLGE